MAKHNPCPDFCGNHPSGCFVPIALPGGAIDGQSLIFDSSSPLQLAWGPIAKGDRGEPGPPGPPGRDGRDGTNGLNGLPGTAGRDGSQGIQGPPGRDGTNGLNGRDGSNGLNGITPYIGANLNWFVGNFDTGQRAVGVDGKDGQDGRMGPAGKDGSRGLQGEQGPPGPSVITAQQLTNILERLSLLEARLTTIEGGTP